MTHRRIENTNKCGECGGSLTGMRSDAKWCSATCRSRAKKNADRPLHRATRTAWHKARGRWLRHHLDPERAVEMLQRGCMICRQSFATPEDAKVDHDHGCCPGPLSCGACVRGMLCHGCNAGLGLFGDDPARLLAAVEYLRRGPLDTA